MFNGNCSDVCLVGICRSDGIDVVPPAIDLLSLYAFAFGPFGELHMRVGSLGSIGPELWFQRVPQDTGRNIRECNVCQT